MPSSITHQTYFTRQVQLILAKISARNSLKDSSMIEYAIDYFHQHSLNPHNEHLPLKEIEKREDARIQRQLTLHTICHDILTLCEGDTFEETNRKSAQLLGTIQLISPIEGKKIAAHNEQCKALYKAVLCLRLLDKLCLDKTIADSYIKDFIGNITPDLYVKFASVAPIEYQRFVEQVKVPLIMAALIQDIGHFHPDAQAILCGEHNDQDPYRALDIENRKKLLQINYQNTLNFLISGIGVGEYIGNSRVDKNEFDHDEKQKISFVKQILKSSINPKNGIGNLLKVPQIYTSIILSTKPNYNYKSLPKVFQVLNLNAERGHCSQKVADALYQITGMFPQGFGIVCMPNDAFLENGDCYEYAVVNQLYPEDPLAPNCRMATRRMAFISFGQNIVVKASCNLYFTAVANKVASISRERLDEILSLLASDFKERQALDILPRCWQSEEFFSNKKNQKLWNIMS